MKAGSVQLIVTSPPYFGLRKYSAGPGEIGSEPTPEEFIDALVTVGRELWRVLRDDGTLVINLGDSYNGSGGAGGDYAPGGLKDGQPRFPGRNVTALQTGDRMNIPHRVAAALQADGWLWRDTIIWQKLSAMPESLNGTRWERCRVKVASVWTDDHPHPSKRGDGVNYERDNHAEWSDCPGCDKCRATDGLVLRRGSWRTTNAHEYIFVFAKGMGYFADREAVKTETTGGAHSKGKKLAPPVEKAGIGHADWHKYTPDLVSHANPRNVMTFKATPFGGAHYATFPTTLPEFFIRAFTPEAGCCAECGAAWARVVDTRPNPMGITGGEHREPERNGGLGKRDRDYSEEKEIGAAVTIGHRRTCDHDAPAVPAVVFDPFVGSGSTLIAARALGRSGIGLDLSEKYLREIARERLGLSAVHAWSNGTGKEASGDLSDLPMFTELP